jgi:putative transposase
MLAGLSTRRYGSGLEPVGEQAAATVTATTRSTISRRFVTAGETAQVELMGANLSGLDLVAFKVDGCTSATTSAWWLCACPSTG